MATINDLQNIRYSGDLRIDALLDSGPNWNYLNPQRNTLYYTFDIINDVAGNTSALTAFNAAQRSAATSILNQVSTLTGIRFQETSSGNLADLHFSACDIDGSQVSGLCQSSWSWSYAYDGTITQYSADAYVYLDNAEHLSENYSPMAGNAGYQVLLHEIGHALGLSHPFDGPYYLPYSVDDTDHTVMSYEWTGADKSSFQAFDLLALQWLYGGDGLGGQYGINSTFGPSVGTAGNDTLNGDPLDISNNDTLTGQAGNDLLSGLSGNDRLDGGSGNDTLDGGTGNDTLAGGSGNDTYLVDATGDVLSETSMVATEIDLVRSTISFVLNTSGRTEIENLVLLGSSNLNATGNTKANTLTGNASSNVLSGLDGADTLNGMAGNDRLGGGNGNDTLNGGTGNDTLAGGSGNDTYLVDATGDVLSETSTVATEIDLVRSTISFVLNTSGRTEIENLVLLGSSNLNATGNTKANTLTGNASSNVLSGLDGADTLNGMAGNDRLSGGNGNDFLNGGTGNDTLAGGSGNDTYLVDATGDVLTETSTVATEIDLVRSTISFVLNTSGRTEIENLVLLGGGNLSATGNAKANDLTGTTGNNNLYGLDGTDTLRGLAGNDQIEGGNGNDVIIGGIGKDTLIGGTGSDRFIFSSVTESTPTTGRDVIRDLRISEGDRIDLQAMDASTTLAGDQAFSYIGSASFSHSTGQLKFSYESTSQTGTLAGDVNGDAIADFEIQLTGISSLPTGSLIL